MCISKKIIVIFKLLMFVLFFYFITIPVAFLLKDDSESYARILMHELYSQDNIDILYCGASHVSHGITPVLADKITKKNNFSSGTASQTIEGSYAILQQAVKLYKIEKVFFEMDFAVSAKLSKNERNGFSADYLVSEYLKDPSIKFEYLKSISTPKYYLNHILPIGKDKYMSLNPKKLEKKIKAIINNDYFTYVYKSSNSEYDGKGCVLDLDYVPNGSFSNDRNEGCINIQNISDEYKDTIDKIIALCKENNIELIFYSMPCSDYYLAEKSNYDDYYTFCTDFLAQRGFPYYDFNLAKEKYLMLEDSDFSDDNHLSKKGVYKWTQVFCDYFFTGIIPQDDMFYSSYAKKIENQEDRIYGLVYLQSDDKKSMYIKPMVNHVDMSRITYDIYAHCGQEIIPIAEHTSDYQFSLPAGKSGKIRVISYIDGIKQTDCTENFASF